MNLSTVSTLAAIAALLMPLTAAAQSIADMQALSPEDRRAYLEAMSPEERDAMRQKHHDRRQQDHSSNGQN